MASELVAIDPGNGELLWSYAIGNQWGHNISQPIFDDGVLFLSTTYAGARGLALSREGKEWRVEDVWSTPRIQIYHVTAVGLGDHVYASHGNGMGQVSLFTCVNRKTGDVAWRTRGLGKANTLHADGKFILLDEDGMLALVRATPEKCTILSRVKICDGVAWAVPTLVGTTLYVRDTKRLMALDLG
jgi:outer membrane protein assembly factor BamB